MHSDKQKFDRIPGRWPEIAITISNPINFRVIMGSLLPSFIGYFPNWNVVLLHCRARARVFYGK